MSRPPDPPPFAPYEVERSERIHDSIWCGLRRDWIRLPEGGLQEYHVFEVPDAVAIVPLLADGRLVMLWQQRHPHGATHWEVPAGRIHPGEAPVEAAARELLEETGHRAGELLALPGFFPLGGISGHWAHAFLARDCKALAEPQPEAAERFLVRLLEREQVEELLAAGELRDAFTALSLFHAFARLDAGA